MTSAQRYERFALADPAGLGRGFLIPVFRRGQSNSLFVQHVRDGTIIDFEPIGLGDTPVIKSAPLLASPGTPAHWAFAFSRSDIVHGTGDEGRDILRERLDDKRLKSHPTLGFELAEFLGANKDRLEFARLVRGELSGISRNAAARWCDLSVLTPDLRRLLGGGAKQPLVTDADRLVATTEFKSVVIHGARANVPADRAVIERTVYDLMEDLAPLYGKPAPGWEVEFRYAREFPRSAVKPDVVAMAGSAGLGQLLRDLQRSATLAVAAFDHSQMREFLAEAAERDQPGMIFHAPDEPRGLMVPQRTRRLIGIELQQQLSGATVRQAGGLYERHDLPTVVVQTGAPLRSRDRPSAALRPLQQALAATAAVVEQSGMDRVRGRNILLRARGQAPDPQADAWLSLYDRAWALGLSPDRGICIAPVRQPYADEALPVDAVPDVLLPIESAAGNGITDRVLTASRVDAMLMIPAGEPDAESLNRRRHGVATLLRRQDWSLEEIAELGGSEFIMSGQRGSFHLSTWPRPLDERGVEPIPRRRLRFGEIDRLVVTSTASPGNVLSRLTLSRELELNVRDLLHFPADRGSIFSLLGAQLLRMMTGFRSRTRSDFIAMLIDQAYREGAIAIDEAGLLEEALESDTLGLTAMLQLRRVRWTPDGVMADIVLSATGRNDYMREGELMMRPFTLIAHHAGVALEQ